MTFNAIKECCLQKDLEWSRNVKIKDGWTCQDCGELGKDLLESHHTHPKDKFPELALDPDNGECLCILCHAERHRKNVYIYNMILARLARVLYLRIYPNRTFGVYRKAI